MVVDGRSAKPAKKESLEVLAKLKRFTTSVLPVARTRRGQCVGCGACCKLPNTCWFLRYRPDGQSYCTIYPIRPPSCRKYPRTAGECLTGSTCGFHFVDKAEVASEESAEG